MRTLQNVQIAVALERVADLLEAQRANPFRVQAYRNGAATVRNLAQPVASLIDEVGAEGLERLPGIGKSLAASIRELVKTGRLGILSRLDADVSAEELFKTVPGIGEEFARRLRAELGLESLAALEEAARDGRLAELPGFGPRRTRLVRDVLEARRAKARGQLHPASPAEAPSVALLLEIDAEYRALAEADALPRIAPRRFNPGGEAWLPILHAQRDGFEFTVMFSNTAHAHQLHRTRDWVVLHWQHGASEEQCTVVTAQRGPLANRRVVRGREPECLGHYGVASRKVITQEELFGDETAQDDLFPAA